ncbi:MAG: rhomboid family intramembrane serine protease [Candidatus Eisenbacteria bacterium]|nr:rhomboid family intramembrane serine protease [Candidatus Eisenbacteria bacterium]
MIGIRLPEGEVWIQEKEWAQWVRSGRISPETWIWAGAASEGRWRRAADLDIFYRYATTRHRTIGEPKLYPRDVLGSESRNPAEHREAEDDSEDSGKNAAPGLGAVVFPRKSFSATEGLILVNLVVMAVLLYMWRSRYGLELRQQAQDWYEAVEQSRYYVLVFTIFIHGGAKHLFWNMVSLLAASAGVEYVFGRRQTLLAYFVTGLGAAVVSLTQRTAPIVSVGASGAIFGLAGVLAVFLVRFYRRLSFRQRWKTRRIYGPLMVLFFLPSLFQADGWAHLGGFGTGLVLGWLLRPPERVREHMRSPGDSLEDASPQA